MGYRAKGTCYETGDQAMSAFMAGYPVQTDTATYSVSNPALVSAGEYSFNLLKSPLTGSSVTTSVANVTFETCDPGAVALAQYPQATVWLGFVLVVLWAMGFSAGLKR